MRSIRDIKVTDKPNLVEAFLDFVVAVVFFVVLMALIVCMFA
jgi:hypothetical protein